MAPEVAGSIPVTHPTPPPSPSAACSGPDRDEGAAVTGFARRASLACLALLALLAAACTGGAAGSGGPSGGVATPAPSQAPAGAGEAAGAGRPYVVLVSFDGFRPDYLDRFPTPSFDRLAAAGASAALVPVFPSLTFPTHYSIATGLYPEHHGVVANRFYDPERGEEFDYRDRTDAQDGSWWGGEPIWVTAETQGLTAAAFFFPGTEAAIGGVRPTEWRPYDGRVPNRERVRTVLDWLARPPATRPHLTTLYFSLVDSAGHRLGPDAAEMGDSVGTADALLGTLLDGVDALPHGDRVVLLVVSDHGMAAVEPERRQSLPPAAAGAGVRAVPFGPAVSLHVADESRRAAIRDAINEAVRNARAYLREELPAHLHARASRRIGDVVVVPEVGVMVDVRRGLEGVAAAVGRAAGYPAGMHGWDPRAPEMHGILLAAGPGIARGVRLPPVESIHVYPLIAHLLGLTPPEALDGRLDAVAALLASAAAPSDAAADRGRP